MSAAWDGLPPEEWRAEPRFHYLRSNEDGDEVLAEWNPPFSVKDENPFWWFGERPIHVDEIATAYTYLCAVPTHAELVALRARAERAEAEIEQVLLNGVAIMKIADMERHAEQAKREISRSARAEALREALEIIRSRVQVRIEPHFRAAASKIEAGIAGGMAAMADDVTAAISDLIMRTVPKEKPDA